MGNTFAVFVKKAPVKKLTKKQKLFFNPNGYMPGYITPPSWFIHTPPIQDTWMPPPPPPSSTIHGTGPYVQDFSLTPEQAATLYVQDAHIVELLIDILQGVDAGAAQAVLPLGTPGQLKDIFITDSSSPAWEYHFGASFHPDGTLDYPDTYGGIAQPKGTSGVPAQFLNVKPKKRKKKKAWWLNPTGQ